VVEETRNRTRRSKQREKE